mmetsp:Transcript_25556/g.51965  ORF Transcript_25556/g.51965 Transcript_25556/m.51965 type:complete len:539 (-) Transcript_25556:85-1701(-)|eukprot:CAMPEP_0181306278 /NCGR_PEP_ID=MMETSP1101-20121128/10208_1 /TAXON_ID=46948 /ORGANISM="Rhodomonas abbreviata, Strain Caron Lab Isolate" /LENGTH=538 /DNA_ID=CAMNT_0023412311 /DNA_START=122 /DNA_END=1738 /DNA_ORIENTATION=-
MTETARTPAFKIIGHRLDQYNGIYFEAEDWSGAAHFVNDNGKHVYFFKRNRYCCWSLDGRDQSSMANPGTRDYYDGGWINLERQEYRVSLSETHPGYGKRWLEYSQRYGLLGSIEIKHYEAPDVKILPPTKPDSPSIETRRKQVPPPPSPPPPPPTLSPLPPVVRPRYMSLGPVLKRRKPTHRIDDFHNLHLGSLEGCCTRGALSESEGWEFFAFDLDQRARRKVKSEGDSNFHRGKPRVELGPAVKIAADIVENVFRKQFLDNNTKALETSMMQSFDLDTQFWPAIAQKYFEMQEDFEMVQLEDLSSCSQFCETLSSSGACETFSDLEDDDGWVVTSHQHKQEQKNYKCAVTACAAKPCQQLVARGRERCAQENSKARYTRVRRNNALFRSEAEEDKLPFFPASSPDDCGASMGGGGETERKGRNRRVQLGAERGRRWSKRERREQCVRWLVREHVRGEGGGKHVRQHSLSSRSITDLGGEDEFRMVCATFLADAHLRLKAHRRNAFRWGVLEHACVVEEEELQQLLQQGLEEKTHT